MPAHFLLLEFLDPTVNSFLWNVRRTLGTKRATTTAIHLTIRGPYASRSKDALQAASDALKLDVFKIYGAGRFSNDGDETVFFRVDSPHLRSVWWKPDYPIERYGFEPHISVYRGRDAGFAEVVESFLKRERIQLLCAEHRVVWHQSAQPDLLARRVPTVGDMLAMDASPSVDVTALDRLQEVVDGYRQRQLHLRRSG